ncbi:hypothetical protein FIBSPDRAFT_140934 [Athelia psychrophila]|uniref:F-box domain-containing protein n=1 Tax=Athelia psychrophila TaxID=1759441 RepID=A0A166BXY1_9AGAM|nr:hypothetical protein FIBSPDRAFT_140934 [Fibularhizoctonia sp. CBS 109695]
MVRAFAPLPAHGDIHARDRWRPECAILAGIAARIAHLDISTTVGWLAQLFSVDGFHSLDALQSLRIIYTQFSPNVQFEGITQIDLGTLAPRLVDIHVDSAVTLQHLMLPRTRLTVCHLGVDDITSFALFLQEAVNLVECTILIHYLNSDDFNSDVPPRSPVRHATLERLSIWIIQDQDSNTLRSILPWLDLPALRDFEWINRRRFHLSQPAPEWPLPIFLDFLSRSGCTLSRLWIESGLTEEDILRYLVEMPSVVDLLVSPWPYYGRPRKLMQGLTLGSHSGPDGKDLVPNLEHLMIHGGWHECEEMMQAIESRVRADGDTTEGKRLKNVALNSGLGGRQCVGEYTGAVRQMRKGRPLL